MEKAGINFRSLTPFFLLFFCPPWKLALAAWLKAKTQASNGWLAQRLSLGAPAALSRNLTHYRRRFQPRDRLWKKLASISAA